MVPTSRPSQSLVGQSRCDHTLPDGGDGSSRLVSPSGLTRFHLSLCLSLDSITVRYVSHSDREAAGGVTQAAVREQIDRLSIPR